MQFVHPDPAELRALRPDPLLWEQELDVRPEVAEAMERAAGVRAGRVYWRSAHDHLYALELWDAGRGRPSMATVYGHWDRYEPRPPEHEIDADLMDFNLWLAELAPGIDPGDVRRVAGFAGIATTWPAGSVLRTPEERFADLPGFPYEPRYVEVEGLRMAYVEQGAGAPILCLHGEPTWSYLYRHMIPTLAGAGRVIAPDLIGFGRSDKPVADNAYTYRSHLRWVRRFVEALDLRRITLVCQDWGGLLGLRLLAEQPERFARLVAMNTGIPTGAGANAPFQNWRSFARGRQPLDVAALMRRAVRRPGFSDAEAAAYAAPFPTVDYLTGAHVFPRLVPTRPDHPGAGENRRAVARLRALDLPVLLPWGTLDTIMAGGDAALRAIFAHCAPPMPVEGAGHFIQEDAGEAVAGHIVRWMAG